MVYLVYGNNMATTCLVLAWDGAGQTPETRVGVWRGLAVGMARHGRASLHAARLYESCITEGW